MNENVELKSRINVLITGKDSYIGKNVRTYLEKEDGFNVYELDMLDLSWEKTSFSKYDVIIHVAGMAHNSNSKKLEKLYYKVNKDLAIKVAKKAKKEGVKQFVFMSSMIVYGNDVNVNEEKVIDKNTTPFPNNAYGKSKLQADLAIQKLANERFKAVIIRSPMVYGPNCKGNFQKLKKLAKFCPIFPNIENKRSMIYIDNLCEFIKQAIEKKYNGVYHPQNTEYVSTKDIIKSIREAYGKKTCYIKIFNPLIKLLSGKIGIINKVFGNKVYTKELTSDFKYNLVNFKQSVIDSVIKKRKALIICNMDLVLYNFRKETALRLLEEDYEVYITFPYGERVEYFLEKGFKYIETKVERRGINPLKDILLLLKYIRIMRKVKPDIVLTYTVKPNIYGGLAARINKVPYIANITGLGSSMEKEGVMQNFVTLLYKIAFKKIKTVFFQNTENMKVFEEKKIALGKHRLIPGSGVNLEEFKPLNYPKNNRKNAYDFLFIGRVMKSKGIEQYIEMAERIKEKYSNTKFHILGFCEEEYEERLKELTDKSVVIYHGMQKDVRPYIKNSHCIIHPTYYPEGMSNVLLEASACSRPIITTDRSGCKEIVDDSVNGYMVPVKDTEKLIEAVEKFINLTYEEKVKMGCEGRKKVEKEFDRQLVVNAYMEEIEK